MVEFLFMKEDVEFIQLVPLIAEFSQKSATPFWKNIGEVCGAFQSKRTLVLLMKIDGMIKGYACGYFVSPGEFLFVQTISLDLTHTREGFEIMEKRAIEMGAKRLLMLTLVEPKVFERFGFTLDRFLLTKFVEKKEVN